MSYQKYVEQVSDLLQSRLGARGDGLEARAQWAGRILPGHIRRDIEVIADAARIQANPKLARMIDQDALRKARGRVVEYLEDIDPVERKKSLVVSIMASGALSILTVAILLLATLRWRGYL